MQILKTVCRNERSQGFTNEDYEVSRFDRSNNLSGSLGTR